MQGALEKRNKAPQFTSLLPVVGAKCWRRRSHGLYGQGHALTAADDHFGIAAANGLGAQVQDLEAGAADFAQGRGGYGVVLAGQLRTVWACCA